MDLEFMILDTFDTVRPKFIRFETQSEAEEVCKRIEECENEDRSILDIIRSYHEEDQMMLNDEYYDDEYYDQELQDDDEIEEDDEEMRINEEKLKE
jgi:hypothetical protein